LYICSAEITSAKLVYITRRERFNAAHKLWNPNWGAEKNHEVFGKCANENWHGHNYELFVTVKGTPSTETGCVMDLKILSGIINEKVIDVIDHKNLNLDVAFMEGKIASTENLAIGIWQQIQADVEKHSCKLHKVRLHETENNYAEYYGDR
jgi:6-pyruvoyltetrahydropterin/6-carboxytetrahydropterin synthase